MWKGSKQIGIDLGTTNTLVYVSGKGVVLDEPTVVAVDQSTKKIVVIGVEAKDMIGKTFDTIVVYRFMQDGVIADYTITYVLLRYFLTKALGCMTLFKLDVAGGQGVSGLAQQCVVGDCDCDDCALGGFDCEVKHVSSWC